MPRKSGMSIETGAMKGRLTQFDRKVNSGIAAAFSYQESRSETRMRTGARWTDRTTNARSSLFAKATSTGTHHELLVSHGVSYGIYLETRFSGRYAIVQPEILLAAQDINRLISKIIARM
jgi:hypothetical protein